MGQGAKFRIHEFKIRNKTTLSDERVCNMDLMPWKDIFNKFAINLLYFGTMVSRYQFDGSSFCKILRF